MSPCMRHMAHPLLGLEEATDNVRARVAVYKRWVVCYLTALCRQLLSCGPTKEESGPVRTWM